MAAWGDAPRAAEAPASKLSSADLLRLAASAEKSSEHPIGMAIVSEAKIRGIALSVADDFRASAAAHATNYAKEGAAPDPRCVSYTHDRDYGVYAEYPKGREKFRGRGWCPPSHAEYDGFKAETASRWY